MNSFIAEFIASCRVQFCLLSQLAQMIDLSKEPDTSFGIYVNNMAIFAVIKKENLLCRCLQRETDRRLDEGEK